MILPIVGLILLLLFFLWKFSEYFIVVPPGTFVVVERLGKYNRQLDSGWHILFPYFERLRRVKWSYMGQNNEVVHKTYRYIPFDNIQMDVPPVCCMSSDQVQLTVDIVLFYTITGGKDAMYHTPDLLDMFYSCSMQSIRNSFGDINSRNLSGKDSGISAVIKHAINSLLDKEAGIKCNQVLVQSIVHSNNLARKAELLNVDIDKATVKYTRLIKVGFSLEQIIRLEQIDALKKLAPKVIYMPIDMMANLSNKLV